MVYTIKGITVGILHNIEYHSIRDPYFCYFFFIYIFATIVHIKETLQITVLHNKHNIINNPKRQNINMHIKLMVKKKCDQ